MISPLRTKGIHAYIGLEGGRPTQTKTTGGVGWLLASVQVSWMSPRKVPTVNTYPRAQPSSASVLKSSKRE